MKQLLLKTARGFIIMAALASLWGCGTTQPAMVEDKRIHADPQLHVRARIVGVNQAMTEGGLLKVQAEVANVSCSRQRFNYRFEWFDQNGTQVNTAAAAALMPAVVGRKQSVFVSSVAPTPACLDFRLQLSRVD